MHFLKNRLSLYFVLALSILTCLANTEFIRKHLPPAQLNRLIERHKNDILSKIQNDHVGTLPEIPGFYIKTDPERVLYRDFIDSTIKENNLNQLGVPEKYLSKINDKWLVFAQKVESGGNILPLSAEEKRQLKVLEEKTSYWDWHFDFDGNRESNRFPNWIRNKQGKLICIDSEERSFYGNNQNKINWTNRFKNYLG